jgi:hypothetical protein
MIDPLTFLVLALAISMTVHIVMAYYCWRLTRMALGEKETVRYDRHETSRLGSVG